MPLADILPVARVAVPLDAADKLSALRQMAALLARGEHTAGETDLDAARVCAVLEAREQLASTGVGDGVAIPHGRIGGITTMRAALAVHAGGIAFEAVDGEPARVFVAILAPETQPSQHLKVLAEVSRRLRRGNVRERIVNATSADVARDALLGA